MFMKRLYIIFIFLVFLSLKAFPQYGSAGSFDSRSMGLAKTYTAVSRGVNAIGINPANLIFSENGHFESSTFYLFQLAFLRSGTNFLSIEDFNYFFGGVNGESRHLDDNDKARLDNLFKDGGDVFMDASTRIFSAVWKIK